MLEKRVIICLDVREGKTTKGIRFKGNVDIGDPVVMAKEYYDQGVDELVFYDITASAEKRGIMIDVVRSVAEQIFIPFSVGGGIGTAAVYQMSHHVIVAELHLRVMDGEKILVGLHVYVHVTEPEKRIRYVVVIVAAVSD